MGSELEAIQAGGGEVDGSSPTPNRAACVPYVPRRNSEWEEFPPTLFDYDPHPLMIDLVLENMFQYCGWKELNRLRLVCKHWHKTSLPFWLSKAPTLNLKEDSWSDEYKMVNFLNEVAGGVNVNSSASNSTTTYYHFRGLRQYRNISLLYFGVSSNWKLLDSFWAPCGKWIKNLEIGQFNFLDLEVFRSVLNCSFTPVLETLKVSEVGFAFDDNRVYNKAYDFSDACESESSGLVRNLHLKSLDVSFRYRNDGPRLPYPWTELLSHYPNMQSLRLALFYTNWNVELDRVLRAITKIRSWDQQKLPLSSFDILNLKWNKDAYHIQNFPPSLPSFFENSKLTLNSLALDLGKDTSPSDLHRVMSSQAKSLRRLTLTKKQSIGNNFFTLPVLEKLKVLRLIGHPFEDLLFLKSCPSLQSVVFEKDELCHSWSQWEGEEGDSIVTRTRTTKDDDGDLLVLPMLSEFSCKYAAWYTEQDIKRMSSWMPHLKTLEIQLDNDSFRMVCQCWPASLEHLTMFKSLVDDEGLTGIPEDEEQGEGGGSGTTPLFPNVTDLKELKSLTIRCALSPDHQVSITSKSVWNGFLLMPRLEKLSFDADIMTDTALTALKKKIPGVSASCNEIFVE